MALGAFCLFSPLLLGIFTEPRCTLGKELLEGLWALLLWSSWGRFSVISSMAVESKWSSPPRCLGPGVCGFVSLSILAGSLWIWRQSSMFCLSSEVMESDGHWYCVGLDLATLYLGSEQRHLSQFYIFELHHVIIFFNAFYNNTHRRLTRKRINCWIKLLFFFEHKKHSRSFITLWLNTWTILMMSLLPFWALNVSVALLSMQGQKALAFHQKNLNLCSEAELRSYGFGTTWGWAINDRIFFFFGELSL